MNKVPSPMALAGRGSRMQLGDGKKAEMNTPDRDVGNRKEFSSLGPAGWVALAALFGILALVIWYAVHAWGLLGDVSISPLGWFFLCLGVVLTIAVGAGLMALLFYSNRSGKDF